MSSNVVQTLSATSGWYILRNWNNEDFDAKKVLKQLHVKYGVSPFFKITVEPDPYSPQVNIIRISPSGLGLPDREYYYRDQNDRIQQAYKELIRDVVRDMSTTRNEADKFGTDMFFYEKRIAEITPKSHMLANPITICNHIKVSELKDTVSTIPFYDILTAMYPEANINETTEVIVSSLDYLMEISQIIATTDRQTMNGYLIWTLVQRYLPYLSEKFTSAVNNFNAELFGVRQPEERWEMCATLCQNFMGFAYDSLAERRSPINMETLSVVGETYASILGVVRQRLEEFESMPQLHQQLKQKLAQVQLQIGLPRTVMNTSFIKEYYTKLNIIKLNLFDSVRHGIEFKRKLQEMALIKPSQEHQVIANLIKSPPTVTYSPSSNLVVIPRSLLTQPYFESKFARAVIHGRLGVEIASALVSAVLPYGSFWISDRKLLSPYHMTVNESLQSIQSVQKCLWKYILNLNLAVSYEIANETALATLKHVAAVSVANEALKSFSARDHIHQPTLEEFEDPAIYFLSYSQTQCSDSTQQYQIYDTLVNFKLSQRSMLHLIWTQLPEFSEALGCSFDQKLQCLGVF